MRRDLEQLVERWQATLRLRDWRVTARYASDLRTPTEVRSLVDSRRAEILVRNDLDDAATEDAIVEELVRLHLAALADGTPAGVVAAGQAAGAIAGALRGKQSAQRAQRASLSRGGVRAEGTSNVDPTKATMVAALKMIAASKDPAAALETFLASLEAQGFGGDAREQRARLMWEQPLVPRRAPTSIDDEELYAEVDRRMGVRRGSAGPISQDARGRISFSSLVPLRGGR